MELMWGHWQTLQRLRQLQKPSTTDELAGKGETIVSICNRLVDLQRLGFVKRVGKDGRRWLWEATRYSGL